MRLIQRPATSRMRDDLRSHEQNAKFHAMCRDISRQLTWSGERWDEETWKRILLAAKFGQTLMTNPFTGRGIIVVNNKRSSHLTAEQFAELLGEIEAFGAEHAVDWSEDE